MTPKEAIAELEKDLKELKDALCIHQDEHGTYYADEDAVDRMQEIVDTLGAFVEHQADFVADWLLERGPMVSDISIEESVALAEEWQREMA